MFRTHTTSRLNTEYKQVTAILPTDQVKEDKNGRACSTHGEKKISYRILVGKPERKRSLGRLRRMWEDNIRINFKEIGWGGMGWFVLAQDRDQWRDLVNTVMNI
jgi:hypothetical protein